MVIAGAAANTTKGNSRTFPESWEWCVHVHMGNVSRVEESKSTSAIANDVGITLWAMRFRLEVDPV